MKTNALPARLKRQVLIVDDHPLVREALSHLVQGKVQYHVCGEASTGPQALSHTSRLLPDLILLDVVLKGTDGLRLVRELKKISPESRILIISQHDETTYGLRAWQAGADGYINKESSPASILQAMARALAEGTAFPPQVQSRINQEKKKGRRFSSGSTEETQGFTARELEIYRLIGQGLSTREISTSLSLGIKTVETHRQNIKRKIGVTNSASLAQRAAAWWAQQIHA